MKPSQSRSRGRVAAVLMLIPAALAACDSGTEPEPTIVDVEITGAPTAPIAIGDTVRLTAVVANSEGEAVTDPAAAVWTSTAPEVAAVPTPGVVVGVGAGSTKIVATAGGVADTVDITVTNIVAGCPVGGLALPVGAIRQIDARVELAACPIGGPTGAEYTIVTFNGERTGSLNLTLTTSGLTASRSAPFGFSASRSLSASMQSLGPVRDRDFDARLRAWERANLRRYAPAARATYQRRATGPSFSRSASVPVVGDVLTLNVSLEPCTSVENTRARVAAVTERAIIVSDTANPAGGFTDAEYREIGLAFDTLVFPIDTLNFGAPTDIDQNQRVIIFYTRAVNAITERDSESYVGGFFYGRDLFPKTVPAEGLQACAGSNFAEIFYMLAPDPNGEVSNARSKEFIRRQTVGTIAHEFQHLINSSRRIYLNRVDVSEDIWLNEGLSHIAEELVFYRTSGLGPRQNLTGPQVLNAQVFDSYVAYQSSNHGRLAEHYRNPNASSPYADNDELGTRGATWSFLRYAADHNPKAEREIWRGLANGSRAGLNNLQDVLGVDPIPLARDWTVANYTDDRVAGAAGRYAHLSWNHQSVFDRFNSRPSLEVVPLTNGSHTRSIVAGGGSYFTLNVPASGRAELRIDAGGATPPASLSTFLIRTR